MKGKLNFLGVFNIVIGAILCLTLVGAFIGIPLIIGGAVLLSFVRLDEKKLYEKRNVVLGWGIAFIFLNIISAIVAFVLYDEINKNEGKKEKEKPKLNPEVRRLNNLIMLGAGLITLAGLIFATSNWGDLSGNVKTCGLAVFTLMFLGISIIVRELKLKLQEKIYYFLGIIFTLITFLSIGILGTFGEWFSVDGNGAFIFYGSFTLLVSVLSYVAYKKYDMKGFIYPMFIGLLITVCYVLAHIGYQYHLIVLTMTAIVYLVNIFNFKSDNVYLSRIVKLFGILAFVMPLFIVPAINSINSSWSNDNVIYLIMSGLAMIVSIFTIYYLCYKNRSKVASVIAPISAGVLVSTYLGNLGINSYTYSVMFIICSLVILLLGYIKLEKRILYIITLITTNLMLFGNYIYNWSVGNFGLLILSALFLVVVSMLSSYDDKGKKDKAEYYLQVPKLMLLIIALFASFMQYTNMFRIADLLMFSGLVFAGYYFLTNDKKMKYAYYLISIIFSVLYFIISTLQPSVFMSMLGAITFGSLLLISMKEKGKNYKSAIAPLAIGTGAMLFMFTYNLGLRTSELTNCMLIFTFMIAILGYYARNNHKVASIFSIFIIFPYSVLVSSAVPDIEIARILITLPVFFFIFIFTRIVNSDLNKVAKFNIEVALLVIVYLSLIFTGSVTLLVFAGILSIIAIVIGFLYKNMKSLYNAGIISLITNIVMSILYFGTSIPLWLYFLIGGIIILALVFYNELRGDKASKTKGKSVRMKKTTTSQVLRVIVLLVSFWLSILVITSIFM